MVISDRPLCLSSHLASVISTVQGHVVQNFYKRGAERLTLSIVVGYRTREVIIPLNYKLAIALIAFLEMQGYLFQAPLRPNRTRLSFAKDSG